jgi:hypothetical protein
VFWPRWSSARGARRAAQSSPELSAGSGESGEARREYDRGFPALIGTARCTGGRGPARARAARRGCAGWRALGMSAAVEHVAPLLLAVF